MIRQYDIMSYMSIGSLFLLSIISATYKKIVAVNLKKHYDCAMKNTAPKPRTLLPVDPIRPKDFIEPIILEINYDKYFGRPNIKFNHDVKLYKDYFDDLFKISNKNFLVEFLNEYRDSELTFRRYAQIIERLLLWSIHISKVSILKFERSHISDFFLFVKKPPKHWISQASIKKTKNTQINVNWRPFTFKNSRSLNVYNSTLKNLFNYLIHESYISRNPLFFYKPKTKKNTTTETYIDRYLELDEINAVLTALHPSRYPNHHFAYFRVIRARYVILLLFYTGLRREEAVSHCMGDFVKNNNQWYLKILGKGSKVREIPVPSELLKILIKFRKLLNLTPYPSFKEETPLVPKKNQPNIKMKGDNLHVIIKWAFKEGAKYIEFSYPEKAQKLRKASLHWLRHSYITYLIKSKVPLKIVQENAGHADASMTLHYCHVTNEERHEATNGFSFDKLLDASQEAKSANQAAS